MSNTLPVIVSDVNPGDYLANGEKVIDAYQDNGQQILRLERVMPNEEIQEHEISYPLSSFMRVKVFF